jgi:hypothetical protein
MEALLPTAALKKPHKDACHKIIPMAYKNQDE